MEKNKKIFLIFTAVFLGCVLLVGIVIGTVSIIKNARSVMSYKGIYLEEGVANYLSASYKYDFMSTLNKSGVSCEDTESFWQSDAGEGRTYADVLRANTEKYLRSVLVSNYLFDRNARIGKSDKEIINRAIDEVLEYRADGEVDRFNELGATMGFDYRDFKKAAEMLYKHEMSENVIFGFEGSALASGNFDAQCDEYFNESYARVRLLIIRTDGEIATDPQTGKEVLDEYDEAEKAAALAEIAEIRQKIASGIMNEDAFIWHIKNEHPTIPINDDEGYYFSSSSAYSLNFAEQGAPEVVRLALTTEVGEYSECELDIGTCFIYKCDLQPRAYTRYMISHFFEDFYKNAAPYIYEKSVMTYINDVKVKQKYDSYAVLTQPYNAELPIKFG